MPPKYSYPNCLGAFQEGTLEQCAIEACANRSYHPYQTYESSQTLSCVFINVVLVVAIETSKQHRNQMLELKHRRAIQLEGGRR